MAHPPPPPPRRTAVEASPSSGCLRRYVPLLVFTGVAAGATGLLLALVMNRPPAPAAAPAAVASNDQAAPPDGRSTGGSPAPEPEGSMSGGMSAMDDAADEPPPIDAATLVSTGPIQPVWTPDEKKPTKPADGRPDHSWLPKVTAKPGSPRDAHAVAAEIDALLERRLHEGGRSASPPADDAEFLRRAFLDLNGRIPTADRAQKFLDSRDPQKRAKLIDELLADNDFGLRFARYWRDLLIKRDPDKKSLPNETVFLQWMARQFNHNVTWDKTVRAMLTAEGDEALAGETYFILANEDDKQPQPDKIVATAGALFMGIQLQCCQCHIHPMYDAWNQDDFWGMAAFFAGTKAERQDADKGKKKIMGTAHVSQKAGGRGKGVPAGNIAIPDPRNDGKTLGTAKARLFETPDANVRPADAKRNTAAEWLASPRDPYFAPAAANRLWSVFFARGLVNPLDDMRPDNKPSHPELLELLSNELTASGYDLKHFVKCLCLTQAYQRTSRLASGAEPDETHFSHMAVKVLSPEMLLDSLAIATGERSQRNERGVPTGQKGSPFEHMQRAEFYDTREYDEGLGEYTFGIPQVLRLMNRELTTACDDAAKKLAGNGSREKVVEKMYLAALSRRPKPEETKRMVEFVSKQKGAPMKGYSNALWALLNSAEFVCNR